MLTLDAKKEVVKEAAEYASRAISAVVADYRGLTANQMAQLRAEARKANVYLKVIRNTLAKRAFEGTDLNCLHENLVGPVFIAMSFEAPSDAARLLKTFAKNVEKLEVKVLSVGPTLFDKGQLNAIASMPTRDEALSKLMYVMKAPIEKFVRTLAAPHTKFVRTLAAVRDTKQ